MHLFLKITCPLNILFNLKLRLKYKEGKNIVKNEKKRLFDVTN